MQPVKGQVGKKNRKKLIQPKQSYKIHLLVDEHRQTNKIPRKNSSHDKMRF